MTDPHTLVAATGLVLAALILTCPRSWPALARAWRFR